MPLQKISREVDDLFGFETLFHRSCPKRPCIERKNNAIPKANKYLRLLIFFCFQSNLIMCRVKNKQTNSSINDISVLL